MYESYDDHGDLLEDSGYHRKSLLQPREDFVSNSRGLKKQPGWVFISRKADIGIVLVLLLVSCLGIMWFISQLPFYLETASAHYNWAMDMYATWGTPSMRWLFINLVVGVIVATSGLLSAFGGDHGGREEDLPGNNKGRVYVGSHPPSYNVAPAYGGSIGSSYDATSYGAGFSGPGYESPGYNPYVQPVKVGSLPESSYGAWSYEDDAQVPERETEEEIIESEAPVEESYASLDAPADDMSLEAPVSREVTTSRELSLREMPPPEYLPEPEFSEDNSGVGARGQEAVEILSKVYDPETEVDDAASEGGKHQRMKTDPSIQFNPDDEPPSEGSPKAEGLSKPHTFTIGRVIRRDQLVDFMEPISRKLEGIGRKVRLDPIRSSHAEPVNHSREILPPPPAAVSNPAESALPSGPVQQAHLPESVTHRRRHSAESVPAVSHRRRLSSESIPATEANRPRLSGQTSDPGEVSNFTANLIKQSSTSVLKQRSIVYPPALLSQASSPDGDTSPPNSPPIEVAIPPPPPPHLKLPPPLHVNDPASIAESEELPSFKFYIPPSPEPEPTHLEKSSVKASEQSSSNEKRKPSSAKHSRTPSTHILPSSSLTTVGAETGNSSVQDQQSLMVRPHRSGSGSNEIQEVMARSTKDTQESPSVKDDALHQQIEDFLARFHENMRLQRQESLARSKKRLVELDE